MGTNYFLRTTAALACPMCGHKEQHAGIHIGKSSAGWNFGLRIYPKINGETDTSLIPFGAAEVRELDDWRPLFERFAIWNEYGERVMSGDMIATITQRSHPRGLTSHATGGPGWQGGFRKRDGVHAGKGTYDLIGYPFS